MINEKSDRFVDQYAALDPVGATFMGVTGHDARLTDYSPDGARKLIGLSKGLLRDIKAATPSSDRDRVCRDTVSDEQELAVELFEADEYLRALNTMHCAATQVRGTVAAETVVVFEDRARLLEFRIGP